MKKLITLIATALMLTTVLANTPNPHQSRKENKKPSALTMLKERQSQQKTPLLNSQKSTRQDTPRRASEGMSKSSDEIPHFQEIPDFFDTEIPVGQVFTDHISTDDLFDNGYDTATGKGYHFQVKADQIYVIRFKIATTGSFEGFAGVWFLGLLDPVSGDFDDALRNYDMESALYGEQEYEGVMYFISPVDADALILVFDESRNAYSFTVEITEVPFYTELTYTPIPADGSEVPDSFDQYDLIILEQDDYYGTWMLPGKGYSFPTQEKRYYRITAKVEVSQPTELQMVALTGGEFTGIIDYDYIDGDWCYVEDTVTITFNVAAYHEGILRFALLDVHFSGLVNYTVSVEDIGEAPRSYMDVDFSVKIPTTGTTVSGVFETEEFRMWGDMVLPKGHQFDVKAGQIYRINSTLTGERPNAYMQGIWFILNEPLTGNLNADYLREFWGDGQGTIAISRFYTAEFDGTVNLLMLAFDQNSVSYTVSITEMDESVRYDELNYVELNTDGTPDVGLPNQLFHGIWDEDEPNVGAAYRFTAEAGKTYVVNAVVEVQSGQIGYSSIQILNDLSGDWSGDFVDERDNYGNNIIAINFYHTAEDAGEVYLLLLPRRGDVDITIAVKEMEMVTSLTDLNFDTTIVVGDPPTAGSFDQFIFDNYNSPTVASYSFDVEKDKTYKITATFDALGNAEFMPFLLVLTENGDWETYKDGGYGLGSATMIVFYTPQDDLTLRLLLMDWGLHLVDYTVVIEEVQLPKYHELNYDIDNPLATDGRSYKGEFTEEFAVDEYTQTGKALSFEVEEGMMYLLTCTFEAEGYPWLYSYMSVLGSLTGDFNSDNVTGVSDESYPPLTLRLSFEAEATTTLYLLLGDLNANPLSYTLTIEKVMPPPSYTDLVYEDLEVGTSSSGTFNKANNLIEAYGNLMTGSGYRFYAETGKSYVVTGTCRASEEIEFYTGLVLFDSDFTNMIGGDYAQYTDYEISLRVVLTATETDSVYVLLYDYLLNDLDYTIAVREISGLPELLSNTTRVIDWQTGLAFTDRGVLADEVLGNYYMNFGFHQDIHFAAAYKITLGIDEHINIFAASDKAPTTVYLYKSDGAGGYDYVMHIQDNSWYGSEIYMDFTATSAGDYYIVAVNFWEYEASRYYLTVWNTPNQPDNDFSNDEVINSLAFSSDSVTVYVGATDGEIISALLDLEITGIAGNGDNVVMPNTSSNWYLSGSRRWATYYSSAPLGYVFSYSLNWPQVSINYVKYAGAIVATPELDGKTENSITIKAVDAPDNGQTVEYAINTANTAPTNSSDWQADLTFGGLTPSTAYYVFARSAENTTHLAGVASAALQVTTDHSASIFADLGTDLTLQVYPNPVNYELSITNYEWKHGDVVELFDITGRRVYYGHRIPVTGNRSPYIIDMSPFQAGMYILRIGTHVARVVKQ
ncbi:MAG: T9SS type A sorting domain-containing protein [Bacteroidales bacterium]|nr:T9SS type A sorting domain-containing protein [Bacteroidales bacterium]